jgi:hypothetical protein
MAGKLVNGIGEADTEMTKSCKYLGIAVILALGGAIATATSVSAQSITIDGTLSPGTNFNWSELHNSPVSRSNSRE